MTKKKKKKEMTIVTKANYYVDRNGFLFV